MTEFIAGRAQRTRTDTVEQWSTLAEVQARPVPGRPGQRWRPEKIGVTWTRTRTNDGAWSHWSPAAIVAGHRVEPDGARGPVRREIVGITEPEWRAHIEGLHPEPDAEPDSEAA